MEVYLIRHGMTKGNQEHRYVSRTDEPVLEEIWQELRQRGRKLPAMDGIVTSPYLRCLQTAEALFECKEPVQVEAFRELDFGAFEYKNYQELNQEPEYQCFIDCGGNIAFPGGEEPSAFKERCQEAFLQCMEQAEQQNWKRVAFVVHGGTIMAILEALGYPERNYFDYQVENGKGYCTCWQPETQRLEVRGVWDGQESPEVPET